MSCARGRLYRRDALLIPPVHLDPEELAWFAERVRARGNAFASSGLRTAVMPRHPPNRRRRWRRQARRPRGRCEWRLRRDEKFSEGRRRVLRFSSEKSALGSRAPSNRAGRGFFLPGGAGAADIPMAQAGSQMVEQSYGPWDGRSTPAWTRSAASEHCFKLTSSGHCKVAHGVTGVTAGALEIAYIGAFVRCVGP